MTVIDSVPSPLRVYERIARTCRFGVGIYSISVEVDCSMSLHRRNLSRAKQSIRTTPNSFGPVCVVQRRHCVHAGEGGVTDGRHCRPPVTARMFVGLCATYNMKTHLCCVEDTVPVSMTIPDRWYIGTLCSNSPDIKSSRGSRGQ